jgi:hypothetical protein
MSDEVKMERKEYPAVPGVTINVSHLQTRLYIIKMQTAHAVYNNQLMIVK